MKRFAIIITFTFAIIVGGCTKVNYILSDGIELKGSVSQTEWDNLQVVGSEWHVCPFVYDKKDTRWLKSSTKDGGYVKYRFINDSTVIVYAKNTSKEEKNEEEQTLVTWSFDSSRSVLNIGNDILHLIGSYDDCIYYQSTLSDNSIWCLERL